MSMLVKKLLEGFSILYYMLDIVESFSTVLGQDCNQDISNGEGLYSKACGMEKILIVWRRGGRLRVASQREGSDAGAGPVKTCKIIAWNTIFDVVVFVLDNTTRSCENQNQI